MANSGRSTCRNISADVEPNRTGAAVYGEDVLAAQIDAADQAVGNGWIVAVRGA